MHFAIFILFRNDSYVVKINGSSQHLHFNIHSPIEYTCENNDSCECGKKSCVAGVVDGNKCSCYGDISTESIYQLSNVEGLLFTCLIFINGFIVL
jgi:hypothetical protein